LRKDKLFGKVAKALKLATELVATPRAQEVLERIRAGEEGPFNLTRLEARWLVRQLLDIPSARLEAMIGVPARTIRRWREAWLEDDRARRNDLVWRLHERGWSAAEIAKELGLSRQWVHRIVKARRAGQRLAYRRLVRGSSCHKMAIASPP